MTDDVDAEDETLRARVRALDPAASLPPADPTRVAGLLDEIRSDDRDLELPETRQTGVHERSRLTWLVAAAAVLLIAGVGAFVLTQRDGDDVPAAGPSGSTGPVEPGDASREQTVTTLTAPADAGAGRCAVPASEILARQTLAFDGVVDSVAGNTVVLLPTTFYAGEPTDAVQVEAPPEVLEQLLLAVRFEVGGRYLVSAADGQVSLCGYSGEWSPSLERLYLEAFPG